MRPHATGTTRLIVFAALMIALGVIIATTITRPIEGTTVHYTAEFTDVNGLRVNDDVRIHGVQVGKVIAIGLADTPGHAEVVLEVKREHRIAVSDVLAVRYQTLVGTRYVEVRPGPGSAPLRDPDDVIPVESTVPSFDLTELFNGLQPVLQTVEPEHTNELVASLVGVVEGNTELVGDTVHAVGVLLSHVHDRQQVISMLVDNLHRVADRFDGKSAGLGVLLKSLEAMLSGLTSRVDGVIEFGKYGATTLAALNRLLERVGLTTTENAELVELVKWAMEKPKELASLFSEAPMIANGPVDLLLRTAAGQTADLTCSRGEFAIPPDVAVFMGGRQVRLCNR